MNSIIWWPILLNKLQRLCFHKLAWFPRVENPGMDFFFQIQYRNVRNIYLKTYNIETGIEYILEGLFKAR